VAILFVVGFELAQQVGSVGIGKVLLLMAPFAVAMVLLAIRLWQTAAEPVSHEQEPRLVTV